MEAKVAFVRSEEWRPVSLLKTWTSQWLPLVDCRDPVFHTAADGCYASFKLDQCLLLGHHLLLEALPMIPGDLHPLTTRENSAGSTDSVATVAGVTHSMPSSS